MNDFLRKLFDGEIYPYEMTELDTPDYREAEKQYFSERERFAKNLPENLAEEFERLKSIETDYFYENDFNLFRKGYITGVQLVIEGIKPEN